MVFTECLITAKRSISITKITLKCTIVNDINNVQLYKFDQDILISKNFLKQTIYSMFISEKSEK